jgi:type I restriction enzyme, S subunit
MTGRYQAYQEYKTTDEVWLGDVPKHWRALKINRLTQIKRGASPRPIEDPKFFDENGEYAWVRIADVSASDTYLESSIQQLSSLGANLSVKLEPNELFLSIAGTVGKPCINNIKVCIHDGFVYFPEFKENSKFLFYIFAAGEAYKGLGKFGTQLNLNTETVGGIKIGIPCIEEQNNIVNFLDHETAKIDTLIESQEKLIALLKEKRQAVISHAVTRGLNPNAPMKDSGVEWLGEVPEHWGIGALKHIVKQKKNSMVDGPFGSSVNTTEDYVDEGIPVVRTVNITNKGFNKENLMFMREAKFRELDRHAVYPNDVLFSKVGTIGNACLLPIDVPEAILSTTGSCKITVEERDYLPSFLVWVIQAMNQQLMLIANSNVQPFLNMSNIKNLTIPMPPMTEQKEIIETTISKLEIMDEAIIKSGSLRSVLKERKIALISAAVTGKVDVRDWNIN